MSGAGAGGREALQSRKMQVGTGIEQIILEHLFLVIILQLFIVFSKSATGSAIFVIGTVTFFIQTFFIRDKVYTNFLYTGQILYGKKFTQDKFYTGTKFIRGQSLYGDKVYTGQSLYGDKVYTGTKFIQTFFILYLN